MAFRNVNEDTGEITYGCFLRSSYNYDTDAASDESGLCCEDGTRTQQQFKEECDINTIVENFGITGTVPQGVRVPENAEFTTIYDYQSALNQIMEAEDAFMQMPANIRDEFNNNAGKFVDFVSNPANIEKCREWGLANAKPKEAEPLLVRMAPTEEKSAGTS